ncbi:hypothetical protein ACVIIW_006899 [Bradyrhizobium sp. USDA 4449]
MLPPVPPAMPPSCIAPPKNLPLVIVSVFEPSTTMPPEVSDNSAFTDVPEVVCDMSNVPPAPGENVTLAELAIEPLPLSAVAPHQSASCWSRY